MTMIPVPADEQSDLDEEWRDEQPTRDLRPKRAAPPVPH